MKHPSAVLLLVLAHLLPPLAVPLEAGDFPPVTNEERALSSVPGEPNAPAVVLYKKGELLLTGYGFLAGSLSSHLRVQVRVKILTEQGRSNGEIIVAHSGFVKLQSFEGRTVLPDGRVVPVPADAKFVRKTSRSKRTSLTAMAFPAVEVGAILDYQYELVFKSLPARALVFLRGRAGPLLRDRLQRAGELEHEGVDPRPPRREDPAGEPDVRSRLRAAGLGGKPAANPGWFDRMLVGAILDRKLNCLDPSDRALGFGQARAGYERTHALFLRTGNPVGIVLPESPYDRNGQRAEIDLVLDAEGRLSGQGSLLLTGHHAWEKIHWQESEARTVQAWQEWLAGRFRDFRISGVKTVESPDERKVTVTWSMGQRTEEVLGDEVSLAPSAPLGPMDQPLAEPSASRKTAVMLDFANRTEVELRLRWPEGWKIEALPAPAAVENGAGALSSGLELKESDRSLVYRRRLDVTRSLLGSKEEYEAAQALFGAAEKSDAQALVLVRR